ncbi:hypothetical protein OG369_39815 [Streptomyces sp. NBC_01221]|uniref:hypothetical protein n=1 Tax=Streptomyces sp. NBC_01221 TaxID=2903782 RepID=UPI002258F4F2|nr:hypothetical protein [Streptomyces sp. NBC_01221]MCX4791998.1 hypothetical protein [Streptomyces sp. NBC_01221]
MSVVAPEVTAALIAYRRSPGDIWLTLVDVTSDVMHLASYMHADIDRCLKDDAKARLDERPLTAMPDLHPSVAPIVNPDDSADADHCFDLYVHASDAAAVLRVHTADDSYDSFSAAVRRLLADLRDHTYDLGFDFSDILRAARSSHRADQRKAK